MKLIVSFLTLFTSLLLFAESKYDYIKKFDKKPAQWDVEKGPSFTGEVKETKVDLGQYYKEFFSDGEVYFYYGVGYEAYNANYSTNFFNQVQAISDKENLELKDLKISDDKTNVSFYDRKGNYYSIDFGHERNAFAQSFTNYEVVMYHGHSRYGRGPAFENYWNYFRMGHVFEDIEVNAENPYFASEEILKQEEFPLQYTDIGGKQWAYQYMGGKEASSYMKPESFTKNIKDGTRIL